VARQFGGALARLSWSAPVLDSSPVPLPHPLPDPLVQLLAARFQLLSEPTRVRIIDLLRAGERSVTELVAELGISQQNVSKHLSTLHNASILGRRKDGSRVLYSIADSSVITLWEHVIHGLEHRASDLRTLAKGGEEAPPPG
jgi:DNA-binding transcriptional ArsR family regulator